MNQEQTEFYNALLANNVPPASARQAIESGRYREIYMALIRAGMSRRIAWHAAVAPVALEAVAESTDEAVIRIRTLRARYEQTGELVTLEEAIDAYEHVTPLRHLAGVRGSTYDNDQREKLIVLQLGRLEGLGLPVTSHRENRRDGSELPPGERKPCLALAMAQATGIGESVIEGAWKRRTKFGR